MKKRFISMIMIAAMMGTLLPSGLQAADAAPVTLIVEVEGAPVLADAACVQQGAQDYLDTAAAEAANDSVLASQAQALAEIHTLTAATPDYTYTHVLNGFAITVDAALADDIAALPHVKAVYPAEKTAIEEPLTTTSRAANLSNSCCESIGVPSLHSQNLRGQGHTIAVIDSELDCSHEIFSQKVPNPAWTKERLGKLLQSGQLNVPRAYGADLLYHSEKIPFAYSYSRKSPDVLTEAHPSEHGTHVSGIAAGNGGKMADGQRFEGVAPDAQLLFMGILAADGTLSDDAILAALDDAAKLQVDAVNLSLGVNYPDKKIWFTKAVQTAVNADMIVAIASGNKNRGIPDTPLDPLNPDYSSQAAPADVASATTVASANNNGLANNGMSDFSSWGTGADLELKPEITAPGGGVYSAIPLTNQYKVAYGTSMATPHIAGSSILLRQYVQSHDEQYKKINQSGALSPFLENLMMSTATIQTDKGVPYSPRKQGAGQLNLEAAIRTPVILQGESGKTKINLKDDLSSTFTLRCRAYNFSNKDVTYDRLHVSVLTDGIADKDGARSVGDTMALPTRSIKLPQSVTVRAGSTANIEATITLDDAAVRKHLQTYRNGFFVDGFLSLGTANNSQPSIHIPYCGFYGDWNAAPAFDNAQSAFVTSLHGQDMTLGSNAYFATLPDWQADHAVQNTAYAALSPNGDGANDTVLAKMHMQRSLSDVRLTLLDQKGKTVFEDSDCPDLIKNRQQTLPLSAKAFKDIADGSYTLVLSGTLGHNDNERQECRQALVIDRQAPSATMQQSGTTLTIDASDNHALMGAVVRGSDATGALLTLSATTHADTTPQTAQFRFDIGALDPATLQVTLYDYAMNSFSLCGEGASGFIDVPGNAWFSDSVRYCVDHKLMVGTGEGQFSPHMLTTRAQLVSILWRLAGEPAVNARSTFSDVADDTWYAKAVAWATAEKIVGGFDDNTFRPNASLTREQLAAMLYNYSRSTGAATDKRADLSRYEDITADHWSADVLAWAVAEGILTGTSDTTLAPTDTATRAQLAAVLMRYCTNQQ